MEFANPTVEGLTAGAPGAQKPYAHFTAPYLLNPTNPVVVFLIGAGGTGSQVLTALARINESLRELDHPGLMVYVWDDDTVSKANLGRQLFSRSELGLYKSACLITRINRFFGTEWKAITHRFTPDTIGKNTLDHCNILLSCVDTVNARKGIAQMLEPYQKATHKKHNGLCYWMDFGNDQTIGQIILSTVGTIQQPESDQYQPVGMLASVMSEFGELMQESETGTSTPSCSLADALLKQDLFINTTLMTFGSSMLWNLFRNPVTIYRGVFVNLEHYRTQPIPITSPN